MKKLVLIIALVWLQLVLFAQNMDTTYVGADTTAAGYKLGRKIGSWMPVVMILTIMLLYIRGAYRHGNLKKGEMEDVD